MAITTTATFLVAAFLAADIPAGLAQAPGPASPPGPPNIIAILVKGGQYTTFIRLMKETQLDTQLNGQLNGSSGGNGYTVFAPTDNAFNNLKPGTLNGLKQQEQVALVQFHVLPQFYSMDMFQTASNPVRTQASGSEGPFTLNITAGTGGQVNVSTGVMATSVGTALRSDQPLAVYSVDKVLLPAGLFGPKPPPAAPPSPGKKPAKGAGKAAEAPEGSADAAPTGGAPAVGARAVGWGVAGVVGVLGCLL